MGMAEYIEREALLCMVQPDDPSDEKAAITIATAKKLIRNIVSRAPVANVVLVQHGRWEKKSGLYSCSECGVTCPYDVQADIIEYWSCNYCPNCGAKMDVDIEQKEGAS